MSMPAIAQNDQEKAATELTGEQAERERIQAQRASHDRSLAEQRENCYQKLAVTPCLNEARDTHAEKMRDLRRQEVALNDAKRKRAAADRLRSVEERNSPQAQLAQAQRRGRAMEAAAQREQEQAARASKQASQPANAKPASASTPATSSAVSPDTTAQPQSTAKATEPHQMHAAKPQPKSQAQQPSKPPASGQPATEREKAAEMRRAKAQEREANRKKPLAEPLPVPR